MANALKQVGETGLQATLEFPDAKSRDDFEVAFRGWAKQYQQATSTRQIVGALAEKAAAEARGEDASGYLYRSWSADEGYFYLDFI
jgi:hypothetical protein